jgi:hypothetical protein
MVWRARAFFIVLGLLVLFFVIASLRRKRLKEQYALLWLLMALALVVAPLFINIIDAVSFAIGIDYPPALMIVIALICFVLIFFQFSVTISRFSEQIKSLTQDLALTRRQVADLEQRLAGAGSEQTLPPVAKESSSHE